MNSEEHNSLDDLLRSVDVPADLKSKLKSIPESNDTGQVSSTKPSVNGSTKLWLFLALAASLMAMVALPVYFNFLNSPQIALPSDESSDSQPDSQLETSASANQLLMEIDDTAEQIEATLAALETIQMERKLSRVSQQPSNLSVEDIRSMVALERSQMPLFLNGDQHQTRKNLEQVVRDFPGTLGARNAGKMLTQLNNNQPLEY